MCEHEETPPTRSIPAYTGKPNGETPVSLPIKVYPRVYGETFFAGDGNIDKVYPRVYGETCSSSH